MAGLDDILKALPIDQIASKLGVDPATAATAVQEAGGTILSGLQRNAATSEGSAAINKALGKHADRAETVDVDSVDTEDGQKILGHIFGKDKDEVVKKLNDEPKTAGIDFGALLPVLAPIVMGLLAKNKSKAQTDSGAADDGGFDIGGLIGNVLGGGSQGGGGFDLGSILGGLFGKK